MKPLYYILIFSIILIITIVITRELTLRTIKCDPINMPTTDIQSVTDNFRKLFEEKSPWIGNVSSTPYVPKAEVDFSIMDKEYEYNKIP